MVSDRQIQFLEWFIWGSRDADEFTKQCLIFLVRQSERLTRQVRLVLAGDVADNVIHQLHYMCSSGRTTRIDQLLKLAGSNFSVDYGAIALAELDKYKIEVVLNPGLSEIKAIVPRDPCEH